MQTFLIRLPVLQASANSRARLQMALLTSIVSDVTTNAVHTLHILIVFSVALNPWSHRILPAGHRHAYL
jgi:hypothetical protein